VAAILITGRPGSGKTTLVRRALEALDAPAGGFYTRETRDAGGRRAGFEIVTLDGQAAALARTGLPGPRVGRYGVDVAALERVGVPAIEAAVEAGRLVVIDEIGRMELLSAAFQRAVIEAVRRHRLIFGTIMQTAHPFADELKAQQDTLLFELTDQNRDELYSTVEAQLLASLGRLSV
jgi:nucleoside-triphosphatase